MSAEPSSGFGVLRAVSPDPTPPPHPPQIPSPSLDPALQNKIRLALATIPPDHLRPPQRNEQFPSPAEALQRLQNYAFGAGFAVVTASSKKDSWTRYHCIHHGTPGSTRNARGITEENRQRKRENFMSKGCKWQVIVSNRGVVRGREERAWCLGVKSLGHSHPVEGNPLVYTVHARTFKDIVGRIGRVGQRREAEEAASRIEGDEGDDDLAGRLDPGLVEGAADAERSRQVIGRGGGMELSIEGAGESGLWISVERPIKRLKLLVETEGDGEDGTVRWTESGLDLVLGRGRQQDQERVVRVEGLGGRNVEWRCMSRPSGMTFS